MRGLCSLLLLFLLNQLNGRSTAMCTSQCRFRLCNPDDFPTSLRQGAPIILRAPNDTNYPYICREFSSTRILSTVTETGEAQVQMNGRGRTSFLMPISTWSPYGIKSNISKSFFGVSDIPLSRQLYRPLQGISRTQNIGRRDQLLRNQCIILPILRYTFADTERKNFFEVKSTSKENDCVSFTVRSPQLIVDLTWNLNRHLELDVTGPTGGNGISFLTSAGVNTSKKRKWKCIGGCETKTFQSAPVGMYTVIVSNPGFKEEALVYGTSSTTPKSYAKGAQKVSRELNDFPDCRIGEPNAWRLIPSYQPPKVLAKATWKGQIIWTEEIDFPLGREEVHQTSFTVS